MAEKVKTKSENNELGIGTIFILLILGVFIIWVLTGGPQGKQNVENRKIVEPVFPSSNKIPSFGEAKDSNGSAVNTSKKVGGFGNVGSYGRNKESK